MIPRDSSVGTRTAGQQQAPLRRSLLPGSWWRCRGHELSCYQDLPLLCGCVPTRRAALSPPPPQYDGSTQPQSAGKAAHPRALGSPTVKAKDTKGICSGQTRLFTWIIRWAYAWCWRLMPWKPGGGTDRPEARSSVDSEKTHTAFGDWWHTPQWAAAWCPVLLFCLQRMLLNDPLGCLHLLHHLTTWEMEQLASNCLLFFLCLLPPTIAHLPALGISLCMPQFTLSRAQAGVSSFFANWVHTDSCPAHFVNHTVQHILLIRSCLSLEREILASSRRRQNISFIPNDKYNCVCFLCVSISSIWWEWNALIKL